MVKQTNPDVFKMHKLAHFQRDAHPRRTKVTCGIPSKAKRKKKIEMRTIKIIWVTGLQMFQTTEGRRGDRGDGGERREGASVSFAPDSERGGGVKMHGSIHQSIWEAKG